MLCRPGWGLQKASCGVTSSSAALRSAPCHAPGPYPSCAMRVSAATSTTLFAAILVDVAVLISGLGVLECWLLGFWASGLLGCIDADKHRPAQRQSRPAAQRPSLVRRRRRVLGKIAVDLERALLNRRLRGG